MSVIPTKILTHRLLILIKTYVIDLSELLKLFAFINSTILTLKSDFLVY